MANCAIYKKGSDAITYFVKDCTQTGRIFTGSNYKIAGVKGHLFDEKWTETVANPVFDGEGKQIGWDKRVADLDNALRYKGSVVSNREDVNSVTRNLINDKYSSSEEKKMLRQKIAGDDTGWVEYQEYVDGLVKEGRRFKDKHFPEGV